MAKVLVFGAGPLGSLFAAKLKESGHEISILARGHRLSDIREHGIVLFDEMTKQQTITSIAAVDIKRLTRTRDLIVLAVRTIRAGKRIDPGWQQDNPIALGRL
ncbi:MAG: alpha/beta hydrolase, partial [Clostridia bacterium]|nr:alpha/beta hydrolase [Clostridia bacterium]